MERALIYARVSTDLQRDNYSIPSQVAEAVKYAKQREYALVGDRYVDPTTGFDTLTRNGSIPAYVDDYTSRELSRPGLDAALDFLERVGFDVLIVYALDRLARDPYIRQTLEMELEERGARVEYVIGNYDDTPHGEVRKDLDATFAKWENAIRTERFNRGKTRKAESGQFVTGITPYGYKRNPDALGGLGVDEEQAAVVRWIFEMYVDEGLSIASILKRLKSAGAPSYNGKWAKTTLNRLLKNPIYVGRLFYNKTQLKGKEVLQRDRSEWIEISTTPLVEDWIFEAAQKRFEENKKLKRSQPHRFYMLTGMVICVVCKKPYHTQTYNKGKQGRLTELQVYRHRVKCGHCTNKTIRADVIEPIVWQGIVSVLKDPASLIEGYEKALEENKAGHDRQLSHLEALSKKKDKLKQSRQNLNAAYIDPDLRMSKAEFIEQKTRVERQLGCIEKDMERIRQEVQDIPTPTDLESLEHFAAEVCQRLDLVDPSPQEKRKILELLHVTIYLDLDKNVRLEGWFNPPEDRGLLDQSSLCREVQSRSPTRPRRPRPLDRSLRRRKHEQA